MIVFKCPDCGLTLLNAKKPEQKVKCPQCESIGVLFLDIPERYKGAGLLAFLLGCLLVLAGLVAHTIDPRTSEQSIGLLLGFGILFLFVERILDGLRRNAIDHQINAKVLVELFRRTKNGEKQTS